MKNKGYFTMSFLGISGSGKTMLISGFNEAFVSGCIVGKNGEVISATGSENDAIFNENGNAGLRGVMVAAAMEKYKQEKLMSVRDKNGNGGVAAAGTIDMSHFFFDMDVDTVQGQSLSQTIKLTDYRGGLLSLSKGSITEDDITECDAFADNVESSEVLFILLDGIKLAQYRDNESLRKSKTGADRINTLMNALIKKSRKGITVELLVTKVDSDQIPEDLRKNNYLELCKLACSTIDCVSARSQMLTQYYGWNFSVIPVSAVGANTTITSYIPEIDEYYCELKNRANIHQTNIDEAFIYGLRSAMTNRYKECSEQIAKYDAKIAEEQKKMNIFNIRQCKETIHWLNDEKQAVVECRNEYIAILNAINEGFSNKFTAIRRFGVAS